MTTLNEFKAELASLKRVNPLEGLRVELATEDMASRYADQYAALETELATTATGQHSKVQAYLEDLSHREFDLRDQLATPNTGTLPGLSFRASRLLRTFEADLAGEYRTVATPILRRYEAKLHSTLHLLPTENALPASFPDLKTAKIENIVAVTAPGEAPLRTPPKFVPNLTTVTADQPPIEKAVAPALAKTPPAFVPTLTVVVETTAPAPKPEPKDIWTRDILNKANRQVMEKVRSGAPENRVELLRDIGVMRQEALDELERRVKTPETYESDRHILDQADFLRAMAKEVKSRIITDTQIETAAQMQAAKVAERTAPHMEAASVRAREELDFMKPAKKGFFSRMAEKAGAFIKDKIVDPIRNHAVGFGTGVAVAAAGTAASLVAPPTQKTVDPQVAQQKVDLPAPTANAFTAIVQPDAKAAPAPAAEPTSRVVVDSVTTPDAKVKTASVKTSFAEKAFEAYKVPDSLKVTFNDGSTSRFDKNTWENAYKQVGLPFDLGTKSLTNG